MNAGVVMSGYAPPPMPKPLRAGWAIRAPEGMSGITDWRHVGGGQWRYFQDSIAEVAATAVVRDCWSATQSTASANTAVGVTCAVLLPNGMVLGASDTGLKTYSPDRRLWSGAIGSTPTAYLTLLADGRVYATPSGGNTSAFLYDPRTNRATAAAGTYPGTSATFGACTLLRDGRVFVTPQTSTTARIYNPANDTLTIPTGTYPSGAHRACVLLPDGRVFLVPRSGTSARIYDPANDTLVVASGVYSSSGYVEFSNAVLLANGHVFVVPSGAGSGGKAYIYDPTNDTLTMLRHQFPVSGTNVTTTASGVLLPDGRVFICPLKNNAPGVSIAYLYDPVADSLEKRTAPYLGLSIAGDTGVCVLLGNGQVLACASSGFAIGQKTNIYGSEGQSLRESVSLSPYYNGRL